MKKVINIENSDKNVVMVLAISEPDVVKLNNEFFVIEDYTEEPNVSDKELDINYPVYDKKLNKFYWVTTNYQKTATERVLFEENTNKEIANLKNEIMNIQDILNNFKNPLIEEE